jgi:hypothetical protein
MKLVPGVAKRAVRLAGYLAQDLTEAVVEIAHAVRGRVQRWTHRRRGKNHTRRRAG